MKGALTHAVACLVSLSVLGFEGAASDKDPARPGPAAAPIREGVGGGGVGVGLGVIKGPDGRGGSIDGTVRDGMTGRLVPAARVRAEEEGAGKTGVFPWEGGRRPEATADRNGRFRLDGLASGRHRLSATARGLGSGFKASVTPGARVELYVLPSGWISGTVMHADGWPASGVLVRAEAEDLSTEGPSATSDAGGRFEIGGLDAGIYRLVARRPNHAPSVTPNIRVEVGAETRADLVLAAGAAVRGRLVGANGEPAAGRVVVQELDRQTPPRSLAEVLAARAGPDGLFRIEGVPPGAHVFNVLSTGHAPKRVEIEIDARRREADLGDVVLDPGLAIRGQVREKLGQPVASARVRGLPVGAVAWGASASETRTDPEGSFGLVLSGPGAYRVTVVAEGYGPAARQVEAGADNLEFVLDPAGTITGWVVDEQDRPLVDDEFLVQAEPVRLTGSGPLPLPRGEGEPGGRFSLRDVAPGTYVLEIAARDRLAAAVSNVTVAAGQTTDLGRIRLRSGGRVRGSVTDSIGTPVVAATVTARLAGRESWRRPSGPNATTDAEGRFELGGLAAGTLDLVATHPGFAPGSVTGVEVDPAGDPGETRIVLGRGGRIQGWVRRRDGTGIPGMRVSVASADSGLVPPGSGALPTRADGSFTVEHVPAGRALVTVLVRASPGRYLGTHAREVDVREGETAAIELLLRSVLVGGRVTRGGEPAPGVKLSLRPRQGTFVSQGPVATEAEASVGPHRLSGVTRDDGTYELIADEPGSHLVRVESGDGRLSHSGREVEVPDADGFTLDLDVGRLPLSGVVVDAGDDQPVAQATVTATPRRAGGSRMLVRATTGPDGRFALELDPGEYTLEARAVDDRHARLSVAVTAATPEVRMALARGLSISGRVVDAGARGIGGLYVSATTADGTRSTRRGADTLPDGSFRLTGLEPRPYSLFAGSELAGFALHPPATPGGPPVTLRLGPGGRVRLQVSGTEGQPVEGARATALTVNAVEVAGATRSVSTDGQGLAELTVPAGVVEIRVDRETLVASVTVRVPEGGTVPATVRLADRR